MAFAAESIDQALHVMHFVPDTVADLWRVAILMMESALVGKIIFGLINKRSFMHYLPWDRRVAWLCVLCFTLRNLFVQIELFGLPMTWEGAPATTAALIFGLIAVHKVRVPVHVREDPQPLSELESSPDPNPPRSPDQAEAIR